MRRLFNAALLTLGVLLAVLGLAAAVLTGPDDTVALASKEIDEAAGGPVVTHPALTAFSNVDLVVTASAPGGVFVGSAHHVDLADLVKDAKHFEVTRMLPSVAGGFGGVAHGGAKFMRSERDAVADLDVWREQASGDGTQQIVVPLRDEPVGVFAQATGVVEAPTLGVSLRIAGLFVCSLLVAGAGIAVVVLWWWRRRRARRTPSPEAAWSVERPLAGYDQMEVTSHVLGHAPVRRVVAGMAVTAVALSGCAAPTTLAVDTPRKVALEAEALPDLVAEQNEARKVAVKAARFPKSDPGKWSQVLAGPLLETARFTTSYEEVSKERSIRPPAAQAGEQVWSPSFDSYPMWAFAEVDDLEAPLTVASVRGRKKREAKDRKAGKKQPKMTNLVVFSRESASQGWRAFSAVPVVAGSLPAPVDAHPDPTPDDRTMERARTAAQRVESWWRTGKGLEVDAESERIRPNVAMFRLDDDRLPTRLDFSEWSDPDERLRVVEVEDGHLVVTTFKLRVTLVDPEGPTLSWRHPGSLVMGQNKHGPHTRTMVTGVVHLPADGEPRLLGSDIINQLG